MSAWKWVSGDVLSHAAMEAIWPLPRVIPGPWRINQREIDEANARCRALRSWVNDAPELSWRERAAYRGWLDFCENDNKRAQTSLDTNERERFEEKWNRRRAERAAQVERANITKPPPQTLAGLTDNRENIQRSDTRAQAGDSRGTEG